MLVLLKIYLIMCYFFLPLSFSHNAGQSMLQIAETYRQIEAEREQTVS